MGKSSYDTLSSFRPISLGNSFAKIFEKVILGRLQWHAKRGNWVSDNQHGFMDGKSTETAVHSLVDFVETNFESKQVTACALIDIKSAFDSAWHPAILAALIRRGCPNYLVRLVSSFLSNRKVTLSHNGSKVESDVNLGCPQGGVLSPFLWVILIDDLLRLNFPFPFRIIAYADDLTVMTSHKDALMATKNLQSMCDAIAAWYINTKLFINASKTILLLFSRKNFDKSGHSIIIDSTNIYPSEEAVLLGFTIDSRLNWMAHVTAKCLAAKRTFFAARKNLRAIWGINRTTLLFPYTSTVEPILLYGCSVWASFPKLRRA